MTTNQIAYHSLLEQRRSNQERERENFRSNLAREGETYRSNVAKERENERSNKERERENRRTNVANESIKQQSNSLRDRELVENARHNKVQEGIGISDSVAKHTASIGSIIKGVGSILS